MLIMAFWPYRGETCGNTGRCVEDVWKTFGRRLEDVVNTGEILEDVVN